MVAYVCHHLSDNYVDLSDLYVRVDLSDNLVVICMALTGQDTFSNRSDKTTYRSDKSS